MTMLKKKLLTDRSGELYEQMLEEKAKELSAAIDAEVMRSLFKESGWHEVVLDWIMTHETSCEIDDWVDINIKGNHWTQGLVWLFEDEKDAMWFKMRWLG